MIRIITIFFCTVLALNLYINRAETVIPLAMSEAPTVTFDETVRGWAQELSASMPEVQVNETVKGNCLPVAVELEKRIIASGHIAYIVAIMPDDQLAGHAMVMYNSEMYGDVDSVIDNGYATDFVVHPRANLYNGTFGEYRGVCSDPDPLTGSCSVVGLEQETK